VQVFEGKKEGRTELMGRRGRRHKQLPNNLKENRRYWKLKEEALHCTLWSTCFGKGYGPVVRQTREEKGHTKHKLETAPGKFSFHSTHILLLHLTVANLMFHRSGLFGSTSKE